MFRVQVMESVDSTNEVVKRAIEEGEAEGLVVRAYRQTGGYGRQGRVWQSPKGGMYESVLLRPRVEARELPTLALVAALAVRRALAGLVSGEQACRIKVKWPNDVVLVDEAHEGIAVASFLREAPRDADCGCGKRVRAHYEKLCGISSEVHAGGVCIGIGVNVLPPRTRVAPDGKNAPAYLSELGFIVPKSEKAAIDEVGDAVLCAFGALYARWCDEGFSSLAGEFAEHSMLAGRFVQMANRSGEIVCEGVVSGIDRDGRLLLKQADGAPVAVSSGEVHTV